MRFRFLVLACVFVLSVWPARLAWGQSITARNDYKLARSYAEKKQWKRALKLLEEALKEDASYADAHYLKGVCHLALHQYDEAEKHLTRCIDLNPQFFLAYRYLGRVYMEQKKYDKAEAHFKRMLSVPKGAPVAYYSLGVLSYQRERLGEAEKYWKEAVNVDPKMAEAHFNLGVLMEARGKLRMAVPYFRTAHKLQPTDLRYLLALGMAELDLNEKKEAEIYLTEVIHKASSAEKRYALAAQAAKAWSRGEWEDVLRYCDSALKLQSDFTEALLLKARVLEKMGKLKEAVTVYKELSRQDPNWGEVKSALARLSKCELTK